MKYLTKEWYKKSNLTDLHFKLEIIGEAAHKDDDLFDSLYQDEELLFIEEEREDYDSDPRDLFNEEYFGEDPDLPDFLEVEQFLEQLTEDYIKRAPFSEEKSKELFARIYENNLGLLKENLPAEIYSQIADPRVFALGFCTAEVYEQVRALSVENNRETQQVMNDYREMMRQQDIPRSLKQRFNFHDCIIAGWLSQGKDLVLTLDNENGFTSDNRVTFFDVKVLLDENILKLYWIYDELYKTDDGYEVHILCDGEKMAELILCCSEIRIEEI